jgi:hypothetical protein
LCNPAEATAPARRQASAALLPVAEVYLRHRLASAELDHKAPSTAAGVASPPGGTGKDDAVVSAFRGPLLAYMTAKQDGVAGEDQHRTCKRHEAICAWFI